MPTEPVMIYAGTWSQLKAHAAKTGEPFAEVLTQAMMAGARVILEADR